MNFNLLSVDHKTTFCKFIHICTFVALGVVSTDLFV